MLGALKQYNQFIVWKLVPNPEGPKPLKVPVNYQTGMSCTAHDAQNWTSYDNAVQACALVGGAGVGFVLTPNDPICCVDLDKCLNPDGTWSDFAMGIMALFPTAATELSYSGNGLHLWFLYDPTQVPANHKTRSAEVPGLEVYTSKRFIALGSEVYYGDSATDGTMKLNEVLNFYLPGTTSEAADWTDEAVEEWSGPEDDAELIARMLRSKPSAAQAFDGRATVRDLWEGNVEKLATTFPSESGDDFDHSSADAALFSHLAFWTGKNSVRMDRLFRQSALMREKYANRLDYQENTINQASGWTTSVYKDPKTQVKVPVPESTPVIPGQNARQIAPSIDRKGVLRQDSAYLTLNQQLDHFAGCVYIQTLHQAFLPDGQVLTPEQFKVKYGGNEFAMSADGLKPTKNAWEAFTDNRGIWFPYADSIQFRPEDPPGQLIEKEGRMVLNGYIPAKIIRKEGDVSLFLYHLAKLFPNDRDRLIVLSYLAAQVQYIGSKFQFALLFQGMEGNGKTFLIEVMRYCLGSQYFHTPNASDVANKFNAWLQNKLFIALEEIYVSDKREVSDTLKPLITARHIEIQAKGGNQFTGDNRANFILTSNYKDAIRKTKEDRRYCVFYTPQQEAGDLEAWGMTNEYFNTLHHWAENGGYAAIAHFLQNFEIPDEFNPATSCKRAPATSSTTEAIALSAGSVEQELQEAIDQGREGFKGGWISSNALTKLIEDLRLTRSITRNRRANIMKAAGYAPHKKLSNGRAPTVVHQEGGRPILYVIKDHASLGLKTPQDVVNAYVRAQGWDTGKILTPPSHGSGKP